MVEGDTGPRGGPAGAAWQNCAAPLTHGRPHAPDRATAEDKNRGEAGPTSSGAVNEQRLTVWRPVTIQHDTMPGKKFPNLFQKFPENSKKHPHSVRTSVGTGFLLYCLTWQTPVAQSRLENRKTGDEPRIG